MINLMCLMHQSSRYGFLLINGFIPPMKTVTHLLRLHHKTYQATLKELLKNGVLKEDKNGVVYCERMVKDEYIREVRRQAGAKGNAVLRAQKASQIETQKTPPSSSSSSSSSLEENNKRKFNQKEFDIFYSTYPNPASKKEALARWKKLIKSGELPELPIILSAIEKQIAWRKNANGDFRPEWKHPATWLNKGCWEDEAPSQPQPKIHKPTIEELIS